MEGYRVGALADLISSSKVQTESDKTKKSKKKTSLGDLFVSKLPPQELVPKAIKRAIKKEDGTSKEDKKSPKKQKSFEKKLVDENEAPKKKIKQEEFSDDDENEINGQYSKPSLRYQVNHHSPFPVALTPYNSMSHEMVVEN